jgi:hypothetical protein
MTKAIPVIPLWGGDKRKLAKDILPPFPTIPVTCSLLRRRGVVL